MHAGIGRLDRITFSHGDLATDLKNSESSAWSPSNSSMPSMKKQKWRATARDSIAFRKAAFSSVSVKVCFESNFPRDAAACQDGRQIGRRSSQFCKRV